MYFMFYLVNFQDLLAKVSEGQVEPIGLRHLAICGENRNYLAALKRANLNPELLVFMLLHVLDVNSN